MKRRIIIKICCITLSILIISIVVPIVLHINRINTSNPNTFVSIAPHDVEVVRSLNYSDDDSKVFNAAWVCLNGDVTDCWARYRQSDAHSDQCQHPWLLFDKKVEHFA